jgi:hypothetical protein
LAARKPLKFKPRGANYSIAEPANIQTDLYAPVMAGFWKQHELWDGTYTYIDFLDIRESILVESENRTRARERAKEESKMEAKLRGNE